MPDWQTAANELKSLLIAAGATNVYTYPKLFREPHEFEELAVSWDTEVNLPIIQLWFVLRDSTGDVRGGEDAGVCIGQAVRRDSFVITGYYGYARGGETYFDFQALLEKVLDELLDHIGLGGHDFVAKGSKTPQIGERVVGDYLCHYAEVGVEVERRLQPTFQL